MEGNGNSFEFIETSDAIELVPKREIEAWWFVAAAGLVLGIAFMVVRLLRKKQVADPGREKRLAYTDAITDFETASCGGAQEAAILVSSILRRYLARSMGEPALFETHEEFVFCHDALKDLPEDTRGWVGKFFTRLAELKYAPVPVDAESTAILAEGRELLERIHAA